jgi:spermidine synthase
MAFTSFNTQFQRLGPVNDNGPTIWTYITTDAINGIAGNVASVGYFNAVANKLKVGDLIFVTTAGSPWYAGLGVVRSNTRNLLAVPPVAGVVQIFLPTALNTASS